MASSKLTAANLAEDVGIASMLGYYTLLLSFISRTLVILTLIIDLPLSFTLNQFLCMYTSTTVKHTIDNYLMRLLSLSNTTTSTHKVQFATAITLAASGILQVRWMDKTCVVYSQFTFILTHIQLTGTLCCL